MLSGTDKLAIVQAIHELAGKKEVLSLAACQDMRLAYDFGLDSLDVFELALRTEELCPWFDADKFNMERSDATLNEFFDMVNEQGGSK